jgi:hypothetical protein
MAGFMLFEDAGFMVGTEYISCMVLSVNAYSHPSSVFRPPAQYLVAETGKPGRMAQSIVLILCLE